MKNLSIILTVTCVIAIGWVVMHRPELRDTGATCRVERISVQRTMQERGLLMPRISWAVEVPVGGEILEIAENGSMVSKGDVIIRIDVNETLEAIADVEASIAALTADREVREAELEFVTLDQETQMAVTRERLALAGLELEKASAGLTPEERRQLEIRRTQAQLDLADAQDDLARQDRLLTKGFVSASMVEPFRQRVEAAVAYRDELDVTMRLREKGALPEVLVELRGQVTRYSNAIARQEESMKRRIEAIQKQLEILDARLRKEQYGLERARGEAEQSVVRASRDGVLALRLFHDWRSGGQWSEYRPGVSVRRKDRIADIIQPGAMRVTVMIHEADINRVTTNALVDIVIPALPGEVFTGTIEQLGGVGRDRFDVAPRGYEDERSDVTVFNASISIDQQNPAFRARMSAIVSIRTDAPEPLLVVPREAVHVDGDTYHVFRARGDHHVDTVAIDGAILDELRFAVRGGLKPGDEVYLQRVGEQ